MITLLLLFSLIFQDPTDQLLENLSNDDPVVREQSTKQLIEREQDLNRYKALIWDTTDVEVKWRLDKIVKTITANQHFRSITTLVPLITIKHEGTIGELFAKLSEMTGQKFDARAFGDNKTSIDCVNTPLFNVLDIACKNLGYDWEVVYRNSKGDYITGIYGDRTIWTPTTDYTTSIELTGVGMTSRVPSFTGRGYKVQVVETSFSINNKIQRKERATQVYLQLRHAAEPSLKFVTGPKISYSSIVTNKGERLQALPVENNMFVLFAPEPDTKSVSIKGKATYRFPMKIEKIILDTSALIDMKFDANTEKHLAFTNYPGITVKQQFNTISVYVDGVKDRFLGTYCVKKPDDTVVMERNSTVGQSNVSIYDDHFMFYIYGNGGTPAAIATIEFDYVVELRDISFDFAIDDIPLY